MHRDSEPRAGLSSEAQAYSSDVRVRVATLGPPRLELGASAARAGTWPTQPSTSRFRLAGDLRVRVRVRRMGVRALTGSALQEHDSNRILPNFTDRLLGCVWATLTPLAFPP